MRINKYIADCGICSRRNAEQLVINGDITVNGEVVNALSTKIDPDNDLVCYQGVVILIDEQKVYYLVNKPKGVICTCKDTHDRTTVMDLIDTKARLYPVGRLDLDSSGLIILTNDGDIANRISHPSFEIEKEYIATIKGKLESEDIEKLRNGVYIDGKKTSPAKVDVIKNNNQTTEVRFIIHEGRNRQIRKMVQAVGNHVYELSRVRLGMMTLDGLKPAEYRKLSDKEINYLKSI